MKCLTILILAFSASTAWATGTPASAPTSSTSQAKSDSHATSSAHSAATAKANQTQTASGSATQSQTASGGNAEAVNEGNSLAVEATHRTAATAYAPTVYASSVCSVGWSAGAQFLGFGGSGGKATPDKGCELRENIRIVASLNPALALKAACQLEGIREVATPQDCVYIPQQAKQEPPVTVIVPAAPVAADGGYVTRQELTEAFKRSIGK